MKSRAVLAGLAAGAMMASGLAALLPAATAVTGSASQSPATHTVNMCAAKPRPGYAACQAIAVATASGKIKVSAHPLDAGFTPTDVQAAYKLTGLQSGGRTVAIVDAYGYPTLESDLATYRSQYGLPACTTANGCLTIMNQNGGSTPPPTDQGWDVEQALDVDTVSAACPDCKIIMVQANDNSWTNLGTAVNRAAMQDGVVAISNSYAGGDQGDLSYYNHRGIAITAATGDWGWEGGAYPAIDDHVVAVSGTSVYRDSSRRGYHETAWSDTGSGCSNYVAKPVWQAGADTRCNQRAMGDVSAASDPNYGGMNIYDTTYGGWSQVGGTSEATPLIAAIYGLSGKTKGYPARRLYQPANKKHLYDVKSGSNGSCGVPICTARKGWDGVTGMGTPKGIKAF